MMKIDLRIGGVLLMVFLSPCLISCRQEQILEAEIIGHSMAPTFCSAHDLIQCNDCRYRWRCMPRKNDALLICPNCGQRNGALVSAVEADAIEVVAEPDRRSIQNSSIKRWDVVACKIDRKLLVKRIVGMPGETINFRNGDLFINGKRPSKPPAVQDQLTFPVFDTRFSNSTSIGHEQWKRIVPEDVMRWNASNHAMTHVPVPSGEKSQNDKALVPADVILKEPMDYLRYQHWRCYETVDNNRCKNVEDVYEFNTSIRRRVNEVSDLIVAVDLVVPSESPFSFSIERELPDARFEVSCEFESDETYINGGVELSVGGKVYRTKIKRFKRVEDLTVEVANIDGSISIKLNERSVCKHPIASGEPLTKPEFMKPYILRLGVPKSSELSISRVKVSRDIYFFQPEVRAALQLPIELAADEYYVVGDNLPVSEDSRHFGPVKEILGTVRKK